jgi:DNA-binding beta-propeller fold protein YncE
LSALVVAAALAPLVVPGAFATGRAAVVVLGWAPLGVATDGVHTWVTNELTNSVTELDATTGALVRVIAGASYGFDSPHAVASDGAHVWVVNGTSATAGSLTELDAHTGALIRVISGAGYRFDEPTAVAYSAGRVWALNASGQSVTELDASTGALVKVVSGGAYGFQRPFGIAADSTHVWVANGSGSLTELDAKTGTLVKVISGPSYGFDAPHAVSSDGAHVWVANYSGGSVTELDASSGELVRVISGPSYGLSAPDAIASDGDHVWVASSPSNAGGGSLTEIDAKTGALVKVISASADRFDWPYGVASDGKLVWVTNWAGNSVTELSATTGDLARVVSGPAPATPPPPAKAPAIACSQATAPGGPLAGALTSYATTSGPPFGIAVEGGLAFVGAGADIDVYSLTSLAPRLRSQVELAAGSALGLALTPNGQYLLVADGAGGAVVLKAPLLGKSAGSAAIAGTLGSAGSGAIEVAVSADGRYVFVSLEDSGEVAVFNLAGALADHFARPALVGYVPVNPEPVGLAVSPDGRYLYATSEQEPGSQDGSLATISLSKAEADPSGAVVSTVPAGCGAVRVAATSNAVYVTARESDALLRFSAPALVNNPAHALVSWARVGEAPVGLALIKNGTAVIVADSNRFDVPGHSPNLAVLDVTATGQLHLVGYVPAFGADAFPRDLAVDAQNGDVLVSNYNAHELEGVQLAR